MPGGNKDLYYGIESLQLSRKTPASSGKGRNMVVQISVDTLNSESILFHLILYVSALRTLFSRFYFASSRGLFYTIICAFWPLPPGGHNLWDRLLRFPAGRRHILGSLPPTLPLFFSFGKKKKKKKNFKMKKKKPLLLMLGAGAIKKCLHHTPQPPEKKKL